MNHPALVKTSDQPSFTSTNFLPFTSAEALRSSDISPVPSLNLKPNPCGGTAKKIMSSPYKKFVEATHKQKVKQATKSKTTQLASNALLGPSKRRKRRVCRDPTPSDTPLDLDTDLAVPFADDSMEEDEGQDAYCVFCSDNFSKDHNREDWIQCVKTKAKVKVNNTYTMEFRVEGGVKQGDPLSPTLFSLVIDTVLKKLDLRGNICTRLRQLTAYAADILIIARTKRSLIDTFQQLKNNSVEVGLIINEKKTKYLKCTKKRYQN